MNNPINITNPIEVTPDTQYTITIDVPFNDIDLFHIVDDAIFYITNNLQSSSILKLKEHLLEHPDIYETERIEMKTKTLKTFYDENKFNYDQFNFMALDIQGAELLALKGAKEIINFIDYIYIEVNIKELYENCALLDEIDEYLNNFGFKRDNILLTQHGWGDAFYSKHIFSISKQIIKKYYTPSIYLSNLNCCN